MSNYPDNVTGRELQIAGPDWEGYVKACCPNQMCNYEGDCETWAHGHTMRLMCPVCNKQWTREDSEHE